MEKTYTNTIEVSKKPKENVVKNLTVVLLTLCAALWGMMVVHAATMPNQTVYDYAVNDYNKQIEKMILARENMMVAERNLSKEKLEISTTAEEWNEMDRLQLKIKNLDIELAIPEWEIRFGTNQEEIHAPEVSNMNALAYAVAMHETKDCTEGWGKLYNNCMGVKKYRNGKLQPARYSSPEEAYDDFKDIWGRLYGSEIPTRTDAETWSGGDRAEAWHSNVLYFIDKYNSV